MSNSRHQLKYAIIGLNEMTFHKLLPAFAKSDKNCELVAIFDETVTLAKKFIKAHHHVEFHELKNLEAKIKEFSINVLYIMDSHFLDQGLVLLINKYKLHFICESPLYLSLKSAQELRDICLMNKTKSMIAYHFLFDENVIKSMKYIRKNAIGNLKFFNSTFNYAIKDKNNLRSRSYDGKSALYRNGIYCIQLARTLFAAEPIIVGAISTTTDNPRYINIEETTSAILKFDQDRLASFTISFGSFESSDFEILGDKGRIRLENAYGHYKESELKTDIQTRRGVASAHELFEPRSHFFEEIHHFNECILKDAPLPRNSMDDAIKNMKIIDAIIEAINQKKQMPLDANGSNLAAKVPTIYGKIKTKKKTPQISIDKIKITD